MRESKNKIFWMYSLNSVMASILLTLSIGFFINNYMKKQIIQTHITYYPKLIQEIVDDSKVLTNLFLDHKTGLSIDKKTFELFHLNDSVFRIKIWNKKGEIIWSDNENIMGQVFPNNTELQKAVSGLPSYNIKPKKKNENLEELKAGRIFEFYIPVSLAGNVVGVVEVYEKNNLLTNDLKYSNRIIWIIVAINILVFYFFRMYIFLYADKRHNETLDRLKQTQEVTIFALAHQAELRDYNTGYHIIRTSKYVQVIGEKLKELQIDKNFLKDYDMHDLENAALLHDIGKVGVSDNILNKPGKLTAEEFEEVKKHCEHGYKTLLIAKEKLGFTTFLDLALDIVRYHHEKWDGSGYPMGLKGNEIPLPARIMALSDVYDALRSERPYKRAFSHEESMEIIINESRKHFDPLIVKIFLENHREFKRISKELIDIGDSQ